MRIILFIAFMLPILLLAQKPYELERYPAAHYQQQLQKIELPYTAESAVEAYWLAYKVQRASDPGNSFPASNSIRSSAKDVLQAADSNNHELLAIAFIESQGSKAACESLIASASVSRNVLPYRFVAAFLLGNEKEERRTLQEMESQGMIGSVMKAFGENAMRSAVENEVCITSGMQDLIAIRSAQLIKGLNSKAVIHNIFASKCAAFQGKSTESHFSGKERLWISPVCPEALLRKYASSLQMIGLGYAIFSTESVESSTIRFSVAAGKMVWSKTSDGVLTPADKGLLQALKPLAEAMERLGFRKESASLNNFIKYQANR